MVDFETGHSDGGARRDGSRWVRRAALGLLAALGAADFCTPGITFCVLYGLPLMLVAQFSRGTRLRTWLVAIAALTYAAYAYKSLWRSPAGSAPLVDFRFWNRTLAVLMMLALGLLLRIWNSWRQERWAMEAGERIEEDEVFTTMGVIAGAPLVVLVATADLLLPPQFNVAVLYGIPLFLYGWPRSRALIWSLLPILLALTLLGYVCGLGAAPPEAVRALGWNRLIVGAALVLEALLVQWWIGLSGLEGARNGRAGAPSN